MFGLFCLFMGWIFLIIHHPKPPGARDAPGTGCLLLPSSLHSQFGGPWGDKVKRKKGNLPRWLHPRFLNFFSKQKWQKKTMSHLLPCVTVTCATQGTARARSCLDPPQGSTFGLNRTQRRHKVLVKALQVVEHFPSALRGANPRSWHITSASHFGLKTCKLGWSESVWELVPNDKMLKKERKKEESKQGTERF